jgi:hypothetical protein
MNWSKLSSIAADIVDIFAVTVKYVNDQ